MSSTDTVIPFYPWSNGDHLYASALNAAIANSVALGGDNKNFRTAYDFGAKGSVGGVLVDDTAALNTAFSQISSEGGGRIYIPDTFYAAGALTVPPGVEIYGNAATSAQMLQPPTSSFFQAPGSKLILGPSGLTLNRSCILRNMLVLASSAPTTNPVNLTQSQAAITAMTTAGTGINVVGDNCLIDTVQVMGFNYGIRCVNNPAVNRQMWRNIHGDNTNCIWIDTGGDMCHIIGAHFWPYLTAMDPTNTGTGYAGFQRSGTGIYTRQNGGSIQITQCTVFGWQQCYWAADNSVTYTQCWADGSASQAVGFYSTGNCGVLQMLHCSSVANPFPIRHSVSNGATLSVIGCQMGAGGPGGSSPSTGAAIGIYADGHGPVQCIGSLFNGGNVLIWLGPNTGQSQLIANNYDDAASNLGYLYNVDPAVIPLLVKYGNQVINSGGALSDTGTNNQATGTPLWDNFPNFINGMPLVAPLKLFAEAGATVAPSITWTAHGGGTDSNVWDMFGGPVSFACRAVNDAVSAANVWLQVTRSGYTVTQINLAASAINLQASALGFFNKGAIAQPTVSGAKGGNAALNSLMIALSALGLVIDSTTA